MAKSGYVKKADGHHYDAVTWLQMHPEDIPMARENLAARDRGYSDDDFRQLMAAICLRACIDYKRATMGQKVEGKLPEETIHECRQFFKGDIFQMFVNRIPVSEVERYIRATPYNCIANLWVKNENHEKSKKELVAD